MFWLDVITNCIKQYEKPGFLDRHTWLEKQMSRYTAPTPITYSDPCECGQKIVALGTGVVMCGQCSETKRLCPRCMNTVWRTKWRKESTQIILPEDLQEWYCNSCDDYYRIEEGVIS